MASNWEDVEPVSGFMKAPVDVADSRLAKTMYDIEQGVPVSNPNWRGQPMPNWAGTATKDPLKPTLWEDVPTKKDTKWEDVSPPGYLDSIKEYLGSIENLPKSIAGAGVGIADYITGIPAFISSVTLGAGGILSGDDPNIVRKAAQEASNETYPMLSEALKRISPSLDVTGTAGHQAIMSPLKAIGDLIEGTGNKIEAVTGVPGIGASSKTAIEGVLLGAGVRQGKPSVVPENFTGYKGKPAPLTEAVPTEVPAAKPIPTDANLEMFDKDTSNNMYRARTTAIDENGIPYNREASIEAQTTARMGDLFDESTMKYNEAVSAAEKARQIDEAYKQRDLQRQEDFNLASQRLAAEQEPLTLNPSQGNKNPTDFTVGTKEPASKNAAVVDVRIKAQNAIGANDFKGAMAAVAELKDNATVSKDAQFLGHLAEKILSNDKIAPETALGKETGFGGAFRNDTGRLSWNSGMVTDLMHEAVHASVNKALILYKTGKEHLLSLGQRIAAKHINEIYDRMVPFKQELTQSYIDKGFSIENAVNKVENVLANEREFTAYSTTEPVLKEWLSSKPYEGSRTFASTLADAWRRLMNVPNKFATEFDRFMWASEKLILESDGGHTPAKVDFSKSKLGKLTGYEKYIPAESLSYESAAPALRKAIDIEKPGYLFTNALSAGKMQSWMLNNPVVKGIVDMTTGHLNAAKLASQKALFDQKTGIIAKLEKLETLFSRGEAGNVLLETIAAQLNKEYVKKLSPEQLKVSESLTSLFKDRATKINEALTILGRDPIKQLENYFPSRWSGEFTTALYKINADGTRGRLLTYVRENTRSAANTAAKYLRQQYGDEYIVSAVEHTPSIGKNKFQNSVGTAHADFESLLDLVGSKDPDVIKANEVVQKLAAKQAMDTLNTKRHFKFKAGIEGSLGDKQWLSPERNYFDAKSSLISYIESVDKWLAAQKINEFMTKLESDSAVNAPKAVGFGRQFIDHAMGFTEQGKALKEVQNAVANTLGVDTGLQTKAVNVLADIKTSMYLGYYSSRGAIQNLVQPLVSILPIMIHTAVKGGSKDVISPILIGMAEAAAYLPYAITKGKLGNIEPVLPNTSKTIWKYAIDNHVVDPHLVDPKGLFDRKGPKMVYDTIANKSISVSEAFARYSSFNALTRHMLDSGLPLKEALRTAEDLSRELMVNYEVYAKAQIFDKAGVVGNMAGKLQSFKMNQLTQLALYLNEAKKTGNFVGTVSYLTTNLMAAGAVGLIGMDVAESIYDLIKSIDRSFTPHKGIQEFSPKEAALNLPHPLAVGGLSYSTNKGLFGSFASNLLSDNLWQTAFPIYYGIGQQVSEMPNLLSDVDATFASGLKANLPASVAPYIEAAYLRDKDGKIKSAASGRTIYTERPEEDAGYLKPNVPSLEKAETSLRYSLAFKREKAMQESQNALIKSMEKLITDPKYSDSEAMQATMQKKVDRYLEFGGDPNILNNRLINFIEENAAGNQLEAKRNKEANRPTTSTVRTLQDLKRLEDRYGAR